MFSIKYRNIGGDLVEIEISERRDMTEIIALLSIIIWVACTEIRIQRLSVYNEFLTKRVAEVDARMCIMERKAEDGTE